MSNNGRKCYFCSEPATSKEHVPSKCLFPKEDKFKVNRVTVPSCFKHNNEKSGMDERMRLFLLGTNNTGILKKIPSVFDKTVRSAQQNPNIFNNMSQDSILVKKKLGGYGLVGKRENCGVEINNKEHHDYQESVLRGFYFHLHGKSWEERIFIIPESLIQHEESMNLLYQTLEIDKFQTKVKNNNYDLSRDRIYQYHYNNVSKVLSVCLYEHYFFHGVFCDDYLFKKLHGMFSQQGMIQDFNA